MELIFEFIFELIFELLFDGAVTASRNKKISKWIRYPLIILIASLFLGVVGLLIFLGFKLYPSNRLAGLIFIFLGIFFLIASMIKFRKYYLIKVQK